MFFKKILTIATVSIMDILINDCQNSSIDYNRYFLVADVKSSSFMDNGSIKLKLNEALSNGAVVIQMSDVSLYSATNHRWADKLDSQLKTLWVDRLICDNCKNLNFNIYVSEFNGTYDGYANVALAVQVYDKKQKLVFSHDYKQSLALEQDGYNALVSALKANYIEIIDTFNTDFNLKVKNK